MNYNFQLNNESASLRWCESEADINWAADPKNKKN